MAKGDDPCKVIQKVRKNAYKIELLGDMHMSAIFNIGDLTPYVEDEYEHNEDLRANPLQRGKG